MASSIHDQASNNPDHSPDPAWDSARRQVGNGLLSILMPARNLGHALADNVHRVRDLFTGRLPFEIAIIDDGSEDNTKAELEKLTGVFPEVKAVYLEQNMGKGVALKHGFEASSGNYVLFLDADLDLPPDQVFLFFDIMARENADIVIGSKRHPDSALNYPWHRRLVSAVYYALVKLFFGLPIRDTQTGFKLFKREVLEWTFPRMLVKQYAFDIELLGIAHEKGFRVAEAPIRLEFKGRWGCVRPAAVKQIMNDTLAVFYRLRLLRYYQGLRDLRMPDPPPLISVIVAFPAPTQYLEECMEGIRKQTYGKYEVMLLPDEPSGRTWPGQVREIPTGRLRPAEKRNIGIEQARGDVVAFLDDDAFPTENWLKQAVIYFSENLTAAVGGPAATPANDSYLAKLGGRVYSDWCVSGTYRYRYTPGRVREVDDYPSCNLLVRTDVLKALRGFRTDFWPGEDTYLCMEIVKKLKRKIIYDPRVLVFHHRRKLFLPHLRQIGRYGLHRGHFARRFPATSRKLSYMLPSLFVIGLILGGAASIVCPLCRFFYLSVLLVYGIITLLSSASLNAATWLLTWLGVVLTHIVYGVRFLAGICGFGLPSEAQRFDHPSEEEHVSRRDAEIAENS